MRDINAQSCKNLLFRPLIHAAGVLVLVLLIVACATVPLTGRQQLNLIDDAQLLQMSFQSYRQVLSQAKLSHNPQHVAMVQRVGRRVAQGAESFLRENGLEHQIAEYKWEFNLIEDNKTVNAWCMPGGKVAVYTGIFPYTQNENGLAVVVGHEIAHAIARHGNERLSQTLLVQMGGMALAVAVNEQPARTRDLYMAAFGLGAQVGILLPYSRSHEGEADRIGLTLMAKAGYDPRGAIPFWERMSKAGGGKRPPEFLSTHPAPDTRIQNIRDYLPEALQHYRASLGRVRYTRVETPAVYFPDI